MKTHMNNTQSLSMKNDVTAHEQFLNHQRALHSSVKAVVVTKRREEVRIVKNNKVALNTNPMSHVHQLNQKLYTKGYRSTIDNRLDNYDQTKQILADRVKKNKHELHVKKEHEKQLQSMNNRIKNCKTLQQRKKDKTDPIVNPIYFIKHGGDLGAVTIDQYCKKVLEMNRPQSSIVRHQEHKIPRTEGKIQSTEMKQSLSFGSVPNYSKLRPQSANPHRGKQERKESDLPGCSYKQILNHIILNKLFKDTEMKVLYVRLCHRYGQQMVDELWQSLMDDLQR